MRSRRQIISRQRTQRPRCRLGISMNYLGRRSAIYEVADLASMGPPNGAYRPRRFGKQARRDGAMDSGGHPV